MPNIRHLQSVGQKNMEAKSSQAEERKKPESLPESGDKEFWLDGEQFSGPVQEFLMNRKHEWRQRGHQAVCETCPLTHAIYLRPNQEVREGKIVAKKPIK